MQYILTVYHTSTSNKISDPFIDQWKDGDILIRKYKKDSFKEVCLFAGKCGDLSLRMGSVICINI